MDDTKAWYLSKTVWGGLISVGAGIAGYFGHSIDVELQSQMADSVIALIGVVGGLVALYGRIKADKRVV